MSDRYRQQSEEHLQQLFRQGDQQAVDELVRRHEGPFRSLSLRWAGGKEDVAANGFVNWFTRLRQAAARGTYDPARGPWRAWAASVLRHAVVEELIRNGRCSARERPLKEDIEPAPAPALAFPPELAAAVWEVFRPLVERFVRREEPLPGLGGAECFPGEETREQLRVFRNALRDCLDRLTAEQQRLLVCSRWGQKLSPEEEGVAPSTLRQRLCRARDAFIQCVTGKVPGARYGS
jgi:RNA polymerase sigma factor (sigma-70 family)